MKVLLSFTLKHSASVWLGMTTRCKYACLHWLVTMIGLLIEVKIDTLNEYACFFFLKLGINSKVDKEQVALKASDTGFEIILNLQDCKKIIES